MTLSTGTRLGPYEILAPLGAGGMGEVFRARDTRLERDVAIKLVHPRLAADSEQLRRFEQEARSASQLDHPNILVVHDVGSHEGSPYIVSELLEGEPLREKLGAPLPPRKAIEYAMQVAHGLAAAHEKGIVHRDLKPENLFVTKDGRIKILDFGLAKLTQPAAPSISLTEAQTAAQATQPGVIVGTVAYMSPEQVQGRPLDARTDLFSLGMVLYEMLSGRRPFQKDTAPETMTAILKEEPPELSETNKAVSPGLERIVRHSLEKEPSSRFQSAGDVAFALESLSASAMASGEADVRAIGAPRLRRRVPVWALAAASALVVVLGLVFALRFRRPGSPPASPVSLTLSFPVDAAPNTDNTNPLALSPDGKTLVYAGLSDSQSHLFVRSLDRDEIKPISGTEGATFPFFSPDGLEVAFFAERKLKKIAIAGGLPTTLCDAPNHRGGSWGPDGTIVFVPSTSGGLQRIPASGGEAKTVLPADREKGERPTFPQFLPDGENVLFTLVREGRGFSLAAVSLRTGERRALLADARHPNHLPTGHLVFARGGTLYAAPFNLNRLETTGPSVPLLEDVNTNRSGMGLPEVAWSREGTLAYMPYMPPQRTLVWVDRKGAEERTPFPAGGYEQVAISPEGGRLAATSFGKAEEAALLFGDFARGTLTRSAAEGSFSVLAWAPDGRRIAFGHTPEAGRHRSAFWQDADGSSPLEPLSEGLHQTEDPTSFSPDGSALLIQLYNFTYTSSAESRWETYVLPLTGERKLRPFLQSRFNVTQARFSPDGRWVAYVSNESGRSEVFVQSYPPPGPRWQISTDGGRYPVWARSGRELFYMQGDRMMAVDVETKPAFRAGRARMLFEGRYRKGFANAYDVAPDGSRFLMIKPDPAESGPAHAKVVLNWFEEVKRRVPGGR